MIKKWMKYSAALFVVCMLTACGTTGELPQEEPFTTLTVAVRSGDRSHLQKVTAEFEEENPNIKLKFIELSADAEQYRLISAAFSTEEYLFDVAEIEDVWVDDFVDKGYILPLSQNLYPDAACLPCARDSFRRGEKLYAMPFQMDVGMFFSLKECNWNGDFTSIEQLDKANGEQETAIYDDDRDEMICSLMELIRYMDNDVQGALELYRKIYQSEKGGRLYVEAFKKGDIPVMRAWSSVIPALRGESSAVAGEFQIHNTPQSSSGLETASAKVFGFAISGLSTQPENCEKFIAYCSRENVQIELVKRTGVYPVRQSLYQNPTISGTWGHISEMDQRILQVQLRPHTPGYVERERLLQEDLEKYLTGSLPVQQAADRTAKFLNPESENEE